MIKKILLLIICLSQIWLSAFACHHPHSEKGGRVINLKNITISDRAHLTNMIETLFQNAHQDPYQLSMLLMASAMLGDAALYQKIRPEMEEALNAILSEKYTYKAWLLGRLLISAKNMHDCATVSNVKVHLDTLLSGDTKQDEFTAWSYGYLAASGKLDYSHTKDKMLAATNVLKTQYLKNPTRESHAHYLWAEVMDLQAAAMAGDQETYHKILDDFKNFSSLKKVDYAAWALSIVKLSASIMKDSSTLKAVENPLRMALRNAKNAKNEFVLAKVTDYLAESQPSG